MGITTSTIICSSLNAQTFDAQIGAGTTTSSSLPVSTNVAYNYSQQIFTKQELNDAGIVGPSEITAFRMQRINGLLTNAAQWQVFVGHTNKSNFTSGTDWVPTSSLTTVFNGTLTDAGANAWQIVPFSTSFNWDGFSNIVIAIDENQGGNSGTLTEWSKNDVTVNRALNYSSTWSNPNPASPPAGNMLNYVNNIQLVGSAAPDCSGQAPSTNIVSSNGLSLCEGGGTQLSLQNAQNLYFLSGLTFEWGTMDDGAFTPITGASGHSYTATDLASTVTYAMSITCTLTNDEFTLVPVELVVNPLPTITTNIAQTAICSGSSLTLTADGAATYARTPNTNLNINTGDTVVASPTSNINYVVTGTSVHGCSSSKLVSVMMSDNVKASLTQNPLNICTLNAPVSVEVTPEANVGSSVWEYRFLANDGVTELQPWGASNIFTFTPTADSLYTFYYQMRGPSCTANPDSVKFEVIAGFGLDSLTVDHYDCHNLGGTINVVNGFGQSMHETIYTNNFDSAASMSGVTVSGQAGYSHGRLIITNSATSAFGTASIAIPTDNYGVNNSFNLKFNLTTDQPINNWGTGGADGITYSFGDDATPTAVGSNINGRGTKLRLSFDAAGNQSENQNVTGIYLVYGWNQNFAFGPNSAQTLAFSSNVTSWKGKTDVEVEFEVNAQGKAKLIVGGELIFSNIQMPAEYMNADVSNWHHLFSAATGGDAQRHAIDKINLSKKSTYYGISTSATTAPTSYQLSSTFDSIQPGNYFIWSASDTLGACSANIDSVEIINENPVLDLGADTVICAGTSLVLNAGNAGATYTWNVAGEASQTLTVNEEGTYSVYVQNAEGCSIIGGIHVDVLEAPVATGITRQGLYPNFVYTVTGAQNGSNYTWNFGDGTFLSNGPSSVTHTYNSPNAVQVTVVVSNDCGSTQVAQNYADLSVNALEVEGLSIYPNPATDVVFVAVDGQVESTIQIVSTTGTVVLDAHVFVGNTKISTANWESGVYFITVTTNGGQSTSKLMKQ